MMKEKKKNGDITIIKYSSSILFSTVILAATIISFLLVLLTQSSLSSSFFVFGVDPGMPPPSPPSPPPPPATAEKPGIVPVPPPPPTASTAIDKLSGVLPKTPPIVEQTIDPKDGDTILSSKIKKDVTVATKVDKNSGKKTYDYNRGYLYGIKSILNPDTGKGKTPEEFKRSMKYFVQEIKEMDNPELKASYLKFYGEAFGPGYLEGFLKGMEDALKLDDMLGIITPKRPQ